MLSDVSMDSVAARFSEEPVRGEKPSRDAGTGASPAGGVRWGNVWVAAVTGVNVE